jgi:hypothetical protein
VILTWSDPQGAVAQGAVEVEFVVGAGVGALVGQEICALVCSDDFSAGRPMNEEVGFFRAKVVITWGTTRSWWSTTRVQGVPLVPYAGAGDTQQLGIWVTRYRAGARHRGTRVGLYIARCEWGTPARALTRVGYHRTGTHGIGVITMKLLSPSGEQSIPSSFCQGRVRSGCGGVVSIRRVPLRARHEEAVCSITLCSLAEGDLPGALQKALGLRVIHRSGRHHWAVIEIVWLVGITYQLGRGAL